MLRRNGVRNIMKKKAGLMEGTLAQLIIYGGLILVLIVIYAIFNDVFRAKLLSIFSFF